MTPITIPNQLLANGLRGLFIAIMATLLTTAVAAQSHQDNNHGHRAPKIEAVPAEEIVKPGALSDIILGKPNADITIIEYASMTCSHCGRFHRDLLPELKAKYIDTGFARLIIREFPLEYSAMAVSLLARCAGPTKTYDVIATMFDRQQQWLRSGDIQPALMSIMREFGMTQDQFKKCLKRKELFLHIKESRDRATGHFGVRSTPTFFINGKPLVGPRSIEDFDEIIKPMLQ